MDKDVYTWLEQHPKIKIIYIMQSASGGSYSNAEAVVQRFITTPLERPEFILLGETVDLPDFQPARPFTYTNPVVILINGSTFSAGELCTEILKQLPNVTAVGDATGGGSAGVMGKAKTETENKI